MITVTYCGAKIEIKSEANALIALPNPAIGNLIKFDAMRDPKNHVLAHYWAEHYLSYVPAKKIIDMPYVQLFIMTIIKSDMNNFRLIYKYIKSSDLEACKYISQHQFKPNYTGTECETISQSILALFRHINLNKTQMTMLNSVLKKLSLTHIAYQIFMLECDKYNVTMYNIAAIRINQLVLQSGQPFDAETWSTWPYIYMPAIDLAAQLEPLPVTDKNWPNKRHIEKGPRLCSADPVNCLEMQDCPRLNPAWAAMIKNIPEYGLPVAKKDYSEWLGLAPARPIEFSWPLDE